MMQSLIRAFAQALGFNPWAWLRNTRLMQSELKAFVAANPQGLARGQRLGVVITPWQGTSVPWYTLALGLLMVQHCSRVCFILDNTPFGNKPWRHWFVLVCLHTTMPLLRRRFEVVTLSSQPDQTPTTESLALIHQLAKLNAVWHLRGDTVTQGREAYASLCGKQLRKANGRIAGLLQPGRFDLVLIPGGVYGTSGLWLAHAQASGARVCSFDAAGYGAAMFASNGVACRLQDIPSALARLKASPLAAEHQFALEAAASETARRRQGVDAFASQIAGAGGGDARHDGAVLIALNSSWDAAALGLHTVFEDNKQWIVDTTSYLLKHTKINVIIRQHPVERLALAWTSDDYHALLQTHFCNEPRVHFIAAEEAVNSYELLARVGLVVTYTSTIGIEAAALGKAVVTPSKCYYAGLGFVHQAQGLAAYQALLSQGVRGELQVSPQMEADARLCFYLTQCCNWFFSPFNPSDFADWSKLGLRGLQADANVQVLLRSLRDNIPLATLNHEARFAARQLGDSASTARDHLVVALSG